MAIKTTKISDLTGVDLPEETPEVFITLEVGDETDEVKIDLTDEEIAKLREILAPYFDNGTEPVKAAKFSAPTAAEVARNKAIRDWAQKVGKDYITLTDQKPLGPVSAQGRLSQRVQDAYDAYLKNSDRVDAEDAAKASAETPAEQTANGDGADVADPFTVKGAKASAKSGK
jgi:Lsr2